MAKPGQIYLRRILRKPILRFMAKPGQTSFRRILLSRILLLSVPILLMGEYVTYRKAASGVQETARQNLPESAVRKAERIRESVQFIKVNLLASSQSSVLQSGSPQLAQQFLTQLAKQFPTQSQCFQLTNIRTNQIVASTCGDRAIASSVQNLWPQQQKQLILDSASVRVETLLPGHLPLAADRTAPTNSEIPLQLLFSAPVYNREGQLSHILSIQSAIYPQERDRPGSLSGSTVLLNQSGTILLHPVADRVGKNIQQEKDAVRLNSSIEKATFGQSSFFHLSFPFGGNNWAEAVAGYTAIPSPLTVEPNQKWVILAVTRRENALADLRGILHILLLLTLGLIGASTVVSLFLARDLARPLEKLRDYALNVQSYHSTERVPKNFHIREFNQLAIALKTMIERLKAWAQELETAWKEAQAANQLKNEFLANTSHELRTPLNAIIGCIRLVKDDCCDTREEELDFLQKADDAAIHLLKIINDILDLSKVESGTLSVVMEPVDLRSLLEEAIDIQTVRITQKNLQLHWVAPPAPIPVQADPAKLKQVFINIIANAIKFTEHGSITITARQEIAPDNQSNGDTPKVFVHIRDTGIGVAPEQQQKLFQPFVMADGTRTRKYGGTGLGLAISRKLMELMGGSITLYSAGTDKGTTVEIALPVINSSRFFTQTSETSSSITEVNPVDESTIANGHSSHLLGEADKGEGVIGSR